MTNIDFEKWGEYLGDPPLAMAFLDRIVDGATILKINGKSYRAHRAERARPASAEEVKLGRSRSRAGSPAPARVSPSSRLHFPQTPHPRSTRQRRRWLNLAAIVAQFLTATDKRAG